VDSGTHRRKSGQSKQTARPRPLGIVEADLLFPLAERRIALLARCRPTNLPVAIASFLAAYRKGERPLLAVRHGAPPELDGLRRELDRAARQLDGLGPIAALYSARAVELELEARLAERVGHADFAGLARQRHRVGTSPEWEQARERARQWATLPAAEQPGPRYASDDRRAAESLLNVLERELGRRRLAVRVEVVRELSSRAACGDGVIFLRAGELLSVKEARRIAAHELLGHALPRVLARRHELGLLHVGSARSSDDEEGRALHIEALDDLLDDTRRRELGLRHAAALAVAGGASASECVEQLGQLGCDVEQALAIYARVARGGGLCRELEYLPAWFRFTAASEQEPELAAWLALGRLSLDAARVLRAQGFHPGRTDFTFSTCQWQPAELPRCST
jgi:uncharacterized protein DUF1704